MPRAYVDNASNRSLGRVGMPVGSMVVSSSSGSSYGGSSSVGGSSSSGRTYVDNASNRSLGRVGMPVGSMVDSRSSGSPYAGSSSQGSSSSSGRTYVDNASNRSLGRVGMPVGSMVDSRSSGSSYAGPSSQGSSSSSGRTYVDNASNRSLGRVGMPVGSMVMSRSSWPSSVSSTSRNSEKDYVDNALNRSLGRVGMPVGSMVVSKKSGSTSLERGDVEHSGRTYVDNPTNRKLDRVGLPVGSLEDSKPSRRQSESGYESLCSSYSDTGSPKTYVDNPTNRRLKRVGKTVGTMVVSKSSTSIGPKYYADNIINRQLGRVGKIIGTMPVTSCSKTTQNTKKAFLEWKMKEKSEVVDLSHWSYDLDDMERDLMRETLLCLSGRVEQIGKWQRKLMTSKLPTTSDKLLKDFSGPVIDFGELCFKNKVGSGAYGEIFFADWRSTVVAVKKLKLQHVAKKRLDEFKREISIFCKLDHPNIVRFLGACVVTPDFAIVMEYMQCSLFDALHFGFLEKDLSEEAKRSIILQAAKGLEYLHGLGMAHCDIKSSNVLLHASNPQQIEVKLTDFGLSMIKNETESSMSASDFVKNAGTPRYSAPEVLRGELLDARAMKRTDMYSFGLVVYEILYEGEPFPTLNYNQLRTQVGEKGMIPEIPKSPVVNPDLMDYIRDCWNRNPANRPKASEFVYFIKKEAYIFEI